LIVSWAANTPPKCVPEPLENKINEILGLKREDQSSDPFSDLSSTIYVRPRGTCENSCRSARKLPGVETPPLMVPDLITSKPGSSPPERPGLDNITFEPWSDATCPYTTSSSAYLRFVMHVLCEKTSQSLSIRVGGTGPSCIRPWLTRNFV